MAAAGGGGGASGHTGKRKWNVETTTDGLIIEP